MSTAHPLAYLRFFNTALHYYVAGRASLLCGNTNVTGNILHHAVEMLLKGELSKTVPLADLKDRKKFGHDLPKLWAAFKARFPAEDLSGFDIMTSELQKFEEIRYPDEILKHGAQIGVGFGTGRVFTTRGPARTEPEYQIGVGDVDNLFGRLFPLCRMNPKTYFMFLKDHGRQVLTDGNPTAEIWL